MCWILVTSWSNALVTIEATPIFRIISWTWMLVPYHADNHRDQRSLQICLVPYECSVPKFLLHREELILQVYQKTTIEFVVLGIECVHILSQGHRGLHIHEQVEREQTLVGIIKACECCF